MHATVRSVIEAAGKSPQEVCILDTEASPEHLSRGTASYADIMLAVVEPYFKSLETGRRMASLALDLGIPDVALVGNKVRSESDQEVLREFAAANDVRIAGVVPFDTVMRDAERARLSPFDFDAEAPSIAAIDDLIDKMLTKETEVVHERA